MNLVNPEYFNEDYYRRHYEDESTRAFTKEYTSTIVPFVLSYLRMLEIEIRSVCDLGCGLGFWRNELARQPSNIEYTGVEISEYLCNRFGWVRSTIQNFTPSRTYDLCVCQSVLQYLDDLEVEHTVSVISRLASKALFLIVPTMRDFREILCPARSDFNVYKRPKEFYTTLLSAQFINFGGGLFVKKDLQIYAYDLWQQE